MKIAYIGDFINHGKFLAPTGTSIILLLSETPDVEAIDVYCPALNAKSEPFKKPENVNIIEPYNYNDPISIVKLLKVRRNFYDKIIFNLMPTAFGNNNLSNLTGLLIPLLLKIIFRKDNIEIIYHNSVYTNDISKLGYDSYYDKLRSLILGIVEREIFKSVRTFVFLQLYKDRITRKIGDNQLIVLNGRYLEAITTVYVNGIYDHDYFSLPATGKLPKILMHGSWGPQKDAEFGLNALIGLRKQGLCFDLIISGGINHHFEEYEKKFNLLLEKSNEIVKQYLGLIREADIMDLFTRADLLVLPYSTPGGRSAVLEQAIFFEVPTIVIDFPEYREQVAGISNVKLVSPDGLQFALAGCFDSLERPREIHISSKIMLARVNIQRILEDTLYKGNRIT